MRFKKKCFSTHLWTEAEVSILEIILKWHEMELPMKWFLKKRNPVTRWHNFLSISVD